MRKSNREVCPALLSWRPLTLFRKFFIGQLAKWHKPPSWESIVIPVCSLVFIEKFLFFISTIYIHAEDHHSCDQRFSRTCLEWAWPLFYLFSWPQPEIGLCSTTCGRSSSAAGFFDCQDYGIASTEFLLVLVILQQELSTRCQWLCLGNIVHTGQSVFEFLDFFDLLSSWKFHFKTISMLRTPCTFAGLLFKRP